MIKNYTIFGILLTIVMCISPNMYGQWTSSRPIYNSSEVGINSPNPFAMLDIYSNYALAMSTTTRTMVGSFPKPHIRIGGDLFTATRVVPSLGEEKPCFMCYTFFSTGKYNWDITGDLNGSSSLNFMYYLNGLNTGTPLKLSQNAVSVERDLIVGGNTILNQLSVKSFNVSNALSIGALKPTGAFANYALSVDGNIVCKKLQAEVSNWADKVFDKKYKLMPLAQLEAYIQQNQHLPEIPSEKEIVAGGQDVVEIQKLQMQKIEELTLYVIELQKQIEMLKKAK